MRRAVAAGLLLVGGCAPDAAPGPVSELTAEEQAAYRSLARVYETSSDLRRVEDELIRRCMAAKGSPWLSFSQEDYVWAPYKALTVETAAEYGYSMVASTPESKAFDEKHQAHEDSLTEAELAKQAADLNGGPGDTKTVVLKNGGEHTYPAGGCRRHAEEQLFGDPDAVFLLSDALNSFYVDWDVVRATPQAKAVTKEWSRCMAERNRVYAEPSEANAEAAESSSRIAYDDEGNAMGTERTGVSPTEIEIAVADATCRAETGYDETVITLLTAAYAREAMKIEGDILAVLEVYDEAMARSRELLG
ncbi:MAG: hypothetical protein IPJ61_00810 [Tessaracoccus sp.]|uniref:hypothetical protein n=1 Tax=Tessaracoccus sp. TaxID=1971211 RepID=UPI001EB0DE15|nr:hypothetical protein [Tessaracoccus sp.]MBK7819637.1 hypothetical protein [Tessaracoccus sp.]